MTNIDSNNMVSSSTPGNLIKLITSCFFFLFLFSHAIAQQPDVRQKQYNLKDNLALQGYDAVSYFTGKAVEGKSSIQFTYKGVVYRFVNAANLNTFKAAPDKYEPAYGGWCAYAMGETGEKVKVDPETFKILNGKLYLFYNFWGNNTLEDWNEKEAQLKAAADRNWKKIVP